MAALNFPPSPATNQIYTANGKSWRFDGTSWKTYYILNVQGGGTGNTFYNLGDILVGAGTSLYPLPVGSNNFVLTADNSAAFGVTWKSTAATGITTLNSLTANIQYFSFGYLGDFPNISSSGATHTFNIPIAGAGATGLVSTSSQTFAGQKTFTSAIIGDLIGTATTAGFATTASYSYQSGYGITAGFATTASYSYQSGYGITAGFATTASYAHQSGYGITAGFATTAANINVVNATSNLAHPLIFGSTATGSGVAVSSNTTISFNPSTFILSTSGLAITASTVSTSSSTGALIVSGGVGIGGSLFLTSSFPSSLSGIVVNNGVITSGSWSGTTITAFYGGTGYNSYTKGDILVGAGNTFIKLNVGTDNYVLTASSLSSTGLTWSPTAATGLTTLNGLSVGIQFLAFGYSGTVPAFSSSGSTHTLNIPLAGTGSTGLVSTQAQSFAGIKTFTNAVSITDNTGSGSYTSGALTVTGGVGIGGTLNVQGDLNVQGTFTTINSTTITVADKNIELGVVATPTDLTAEAGGITLRGATNKSINWYSGVGWSSSESWNLASGNTYKIAGTTVLSNSSLGTGVTNSSLTAVGTITTGTWSATAITALYGGTGLAPTFTVGDILYANTSTTWGRLTASSNSGFVLASAGSGATPTYVSPITLSVGSATTAANLNVSNALTGTFYPVLSNTASTASGIGASVNGFFSFNAATGAFGATSVNILSGQSYSVGGNSVLSATSLGTGVTNSSLTALGTITTGVWAGSLITGFYGGTGYNSYTKGDILVGAGSTFIKLNVGTDNFVLTADNTTPSGVKWASVAGLSITSVNGLTASAQFFSTGTSGTGFNISSSGSTHTFNIPIAGVGATGLVSTLAQSFAGVKTFTNDVIVSSTTGSTAFNTGALTVYGGLGVSGQLSFNQAALGYTGATNPSMAFIGSTTVAPITMTVLSDNSLLWEGSSGKLFGINNNLSSGWIFNVGDISGLPIIRANADGTIAMAEFAANVGIGLSNPSYKLHVAGDTNLSSGYVYRINGTSVLSASSLGTGVTNSSLTAVGTLTTGVWAATAITAFYGGTGYNSYTKGDILVGAGNTFIKLNVGTDNFVLTANSSSATGLTWSPTAATGLTTLNGLSVGIQFLAFGYSGTVPAFSSSGSTHTLNIPLAGTGSTGLVSTQSQSFAGIKTFTNAVSITDNTGSGSYTSGALIVTGGVGIGGTLNVQGDLNVQGTFTTINSTTITVADKNIELGVVATPTDVTAQGGGITLRGATDKSINWYSGVGWSSSESFNLASGNTFKINNTTVLSNSSLGTGVTNSSLTALGTITTGTWSATAITAFYGGTGYQSYAIGDLLVGAGSTLYKLPVGTNNYVLTADNTAPGGVKWSIAASTGVTTINALTASIQYFSTGTSGSGFNISSSGSTHTFNIPIAGTGSTGLVSTLAQSFAGVKTFTNDTVISSSTVSTSTTTGALTITGGVGIGGSLFTGTSTADSISGVVLNNGVITTGSWSATAITARYGGTGNTSYTLGDLLVGAGSTFIKLPVGINSYVLGADSNKPSGIGWTTVTPLTVSDTPPASPKNADLWFNSLDGGLLVYYNDVDTSQWVEIALGSGIDLSQPVHITNTTPSTSTSTGALIVDGGVGIQGELHTSTLVINGTYDVVGDSVTLASNGAGQVIYTLDASIYRSVKFMVQITHGTDYQVQEILLLQDGVDTYLTQYAQLLSGNDLILSTYDADLNGGNMRLLVSPTYTNTTYKIYGTAVRL